MAAISAEGLRVLVGDGLTSETFYPLHGATVRRFELSQRAVTETAISDSSWQQLAGCVERRLVLECDVLATDAVAALRIRTLALSAARGTIRIEVGLGQRIECAAFVTRYEESMEPQSIKRLAVRLESDGSALLV